MRQRWGASILNYYQEVLLEEGEYQLTADIFATENSSNNTASVYVGGVTRTVSATNQWQTVTIDFEADGATPLLIGAKADHKANEFICGFDNFVLTKKILDFIEVPTTSDEGAQQWYDLSGRRVNPNDSAHGIYVRKGTKMAK